MTFKFLGFWEMEQTFSIENGNMIKVFPIPQQDGSKMIMTVTYEPYEGTIPETSWPGECPAQY
jgi:hypothetical protein